LRELFKHEVQEVGAMGNKRTCEDVIALRIVDYLDGMSAWTRVPYDVLAKIFDPIINRVKDVNRVIYDLLKTSRYH
jgi:GMP synthase (glutamine-hydrolysing)